ncbi:unnamed protein product [Darwinula stevensoni]|uniref:Sorting nexin-29 n=1 Tax=Darwinula stevensoni TaxID=69355 RepID=A0A7R8X8T9_9CRUS|nr:unnamed protein product [Darwinula stevensoni]CAG0883735.1 unnamed protein product [Darwinula stevensoni]
MPKMERKAKEKQDMLRSLLDAVKQCQIRFGGRSELATENDPRVSILCAQFETVFQHGLKKPPHSHGPVQSLKNVTEKMSQSLVPFRDQVNNVFWNVVRGVLSRHDYQRYLLLGEITTDWGRGRAWLRAALNEHSLERYLQMILCEEEKLSEFYEPWAFLQDAERSSMLPTMAAGLGSILFAIKIDNKELNDLPYYVTSEQGISSGVPSGKYQDPEPVYSASPAEKGMDLKKERRRRKRQTPRNLVSLGPEDGMNAGGESWKYVQQHLQSREHLISVSSGDSSLLSSDIMSCDSRDAFEPVVVQDPPLSQLQPVTRSNQTHHSSPDLLISLPRSNTTQHAIRSDGSSPTSCKALTPVSEPSIGMLIPVIPQKPASSFKPDSESESQAEGKLAVESENYDSASVKSGNSDDKDIMVPSPSISDLSSHSGDPSAKCAATLSEKTTLEAKCLELNNLLKEEKERVNVLKAEAEETNRLLRERKEQMNSKHQALIRENELLKHQLKKYVGAVQMLRQDGKSAHETLASLESSQHQILEPSHSLLAHIQVQEESQYELKLIQVAEMHGELMEFNERLQRVIRIKEATIRRLREELIELRGPFAEEGQSSDDEASVTSDYDNSSLSPSSRALINIWIPSAFLTGGSTDIHHVYIRIRDDEWNVYRRYSQFYAFHKKLKQDYPLVSTFDFPPKRTIGNKDSKFVEERRRRLQHYLRCVLNMLVQHCPELANNPERIILTRLIPFFKEHSRLTERQQQNHRSSSRNPFSRRRNTSESHHPHYTGL